MKFEEYKVKVYKNGDVVWCNNKNEFHRLGGLPALEWSSGSKSYYENGKRHRIDGPAIEYSDGYKEYWLFDKKYTKEQYDIEVKKLNQKSVCENKEVVIDGVTYTLVKKD